MRIAVPLVVALLAIALLLRELTSESSPEQRVESVVAEEPALPDDQGPRPLASWPTAIARDDSVEPAFERVVLVTIDTLRRDHVSAYGYPRKTTPFLDSLAERGALFENAISSISHTAPSHSTMLTGLHPLAHGVVKNGQRLPSNAISLASVFRAAGLDTAAFLNVRFLTGITDSFDTTQSDQPGADAVVDLALAWLESKPKQEPFFLWAHLFDPHSWRRVERKPEEQLERIQRESPLGPEAFLDFIVDLHALTLDEDGNTLLGPEETTEFGMERAYSPVETRGFFDQYDAHILAADQQLERLYRAIEDGQRPGRTLWVITSDHGEGMGSHRHVGHRRIYQEQVAVPFVVHASDDSLGTARVEELVQHVDLMPTLAATVGIRIEGIDAKMEGSSLWPLLGGKGRWRERPAFSQRCLLLQPRRRENLFALQTRDHKYIFHGEEEDELYDLRVDRKERVNLADPALRQSLRTQLMKRVKLFRAKRSTVQEAEVQEEYIDELRALGYAQ